MYQLHGGARFSAPTVRQVWNEYQKTGRLGEKALGNYQARLNLHLRDWLDKPITAITKDMVEERHRSIKGKAQANATMRTLRALLNYACIKYETPDGAPVLKVNPVVRLSEARTWNKEFRRTRHLKQRELAPWFRAVFALENSTLRDYLLFLLFTGCRSCEARNLKWSDVDLETGVITLRNIKPGGNAELPLNSYTWQLLTIRRLGARNEWVFPGRCKGKSISGGSKNYSHVVEISGIKFSPHDLRRTFLTIGDDLDIKTEVLKALVTHSRRDEHDVTDAYICRSLERLRRASQRICDALVWHMGLPRQR